jgi:putative phosphatase
MLSFVKPHLYLTSVLDLDVAFLRRHGLRGLLLDLDCTLKHYHDEAFCAGVPEWIENLRTAGIKLCLLSNGKPRRIATFALRLHVPFVAQAFKPLPLGCQVALRKLGLRAEECGMVGDQIFADILAGRLAGLFTVLVRPTTHDEPWFTRLKRPFERGLLRWMSLFPRPATSS